MIGKFINIQEEIKLSTIEKKLKILIPITEFGRAGGLRVISELANNWINQNHEVTIITHYKSEGPYYKTNAKVKFINTDGEVRGSDSNSGNSSVMHKLISIYRFVRRHSKEYDIILANHSLTTFPIFLGNLKNKTKTFYYIQAYEPGFYPNKFSPHIYIKKTILWTSYFLPITRIVNADVYKKYKNIRSEIVLPPGLDLKTFHPKTLSNNIKDEFIIGCIGRVEVFKGSHDVTEAVRILHDKGYNIKFKVAFNPVNYENYELVKPDGDENLANFYRCLDVLIAPGQIQLGAVHYPVIEAMACKIPVITTGYYPANMDNAYIVPIKRPDVIAETIIEVLENYDSAIQKTEIAYNAIAQFDWKIVSSKFIDLFNHELEGVKK